MSILVIGSMAFDSVETPFGKHDNILGGSATFFSLAARFFSGVDIVACVGEDFPEKAIKMLEKRGIGVSGIEIAKGRTFRWKARYECDMNTAHTLETHLNVFKDFSPKIPPKLKDPKTLFLANIDPDLQDGVLGQIKRPSLVGCDTMNHWIGSKRKELKRLIRKVDILFLNDAEAKLLSGEDNLLKAAKGALSMGPKIVVVKKGEHGVILYSKNFHFLAPAYILETVRDPTGAGDSFAGGMMGYLDRAKRIGGVVLRKAVVYGTIMASFAVEAFSVKRLLDIDRHDINKRYESFRSLTRF